MAPLHLPFSCPLSAAVSHPQAPSPGSRARREANRPGILFFHQHQVLEGWGLGGRAEKVSPFSSSRGFYSPPGHTCGRKEGSFSKLRG